MDKGSTPSIYTGRCRGDGRLSKLSYQQYCNLRNRDYAGYLRRIAKDVDKFLFSISNQKSDEALIGFNSEVLLIHICKRPSKDDMVCIIPNDSKAGTISERSLMSNCLIFYVSHKEYAKMLEECEKISEEWIFEKSPELNCLGTPGLPDSWFRNTKLIKFLTKKVWPCPRIQFLDKMARRCNWAWFYDPDPSASTLRKDVGHVSADLKEAIEQALIRQRNIKSKKR